MKTPSSIKTLLCLLLLPAVHAIATPVEINSDQTNYIFRGDTTYFVDSNVAMHGTTTFENGTILKYNGSGQINIDTNGMLVCPQVGEPAVFTSYNDNSVGETISGSSGTPAAEDVYTYLNCSGTLSNLCFYYGEWPLPGYTTVTLRSCEFFYGEYLYLETSQLINNLFVGTYVDWFPSAADNTMQNNTFVNSTAICDSWGPVTTVVVSDNLFDSGGVDDWTSAGTTGGNNAFYNCSDYLGGGSGLSTDITLGSEPAYQSGPLGDYYLPSDSSLIDAGNMSASDAGLDSFTTQAGDQTPDSGTVDIGYHYPIWHYVALYSNHSNYTFQSNTTYFVYANITLSGTTTFQSGTVLKYNGSGQINIPTTGTIVCPSGAEPAIFTSYNDNTVGAVISGSSGVPGKYDVFTSSGTPDVNTFLNITNVTLSNMSFSYAYSPFQWEAIVWLMDCEFFYDEYMYMETPVIFNNLFVEVSDLDWFPSRQAVDDSDEMVPDTVNDNLMVNNTFVNSGVILDSLWNPNEVWVVNNLFDSTGVDDWTGNGAIGGHNAFYNASDYLGANNSGLPGDTTLSSPVNYQIGPLGSYYLPSSTPLIDGGQWDAYTGAMYDETVTLDLDTLTTQTDQTTDSGAVDIGYHYFVVP